MARRLVLAGTFFVLSLGWITPTGALGAPQGTAEAADRVPTVSIPEAEGKGVQALGIGYDFASVGYLFEEFFFEGDAVGYERVGTFRQDGRWRVEESEEARFKTRMIVVRPEDPADFSGTVFVEWFNVTGGIDAGPTFLMGHNGILRSGGAWVGVTSQAVGLTGSEETVQSDVIDIPEGGLVGSDPARYGTLTHPGDLFAYDIFTQAGAAIRGDGEGFDPFEGFEVEQLLAMGESQSAGRLTTYVNAVHPLAQQYDGFLIHSRGASVAPLGERQPDVVDPTIPEAARIRKNVDVPVFIFETEYDVIGGYADARQPDSRNVRLWEIAGTSHIDAYTGAGYSLSDLGDGAAEATLLDPAEAGGGLLGCVEPLNAGAQHAVLVAVFEHLEAWVRDGPAPKKYPRLDVSGSGDAIEAKRDELGIAEGGVRTPLVDVPLAANTGYATNMPDFCRVMGILQPFDAATLEELYPNGSADYVEAFEDAVDQAVRAGIWLEAEAENFKAAAREITLP
jgi:hypothetical protein